MNKQIRLISFIILSIPILAHAQTLDCSNFKTGEFYTETPNLGRTLITRNDSIQVESNEAVGYHYVHKVEWISDCEYSLTLLKNKSTDPKFNPPTDPFTMNVKITNLTNDSYETLANLNGGEYRYGGTIRILKD